MEIGNFSQHIVDAVERFQCTGCTNGGDISCFVMSKSSDISCAKHSAGTFVSGIGWIQLGLPSGFNRISYGREKIVDFYMFETFEKQQAYFDFDMFNIPVWKFLYEGMTLVRGVSPRTNKLFIQCILEDCIDKIDCLELTPEQVKAMD